MPKILRTLSFIILLMLVIEPIIKITVKKKPLLVVLLDTSKSMGVGERLSYAKKIISELNIRHKIYGFDSTIYEIKDSIVADGEITNIGEAIKNAPDASAYLLISDGNNNAGEDPIIAAKNKNIPIYTIPLPEYKIKDINIKSIHYPKIAYTNEKTIIKVNIENIGYNPQKIYITFKEEDKILQKKEVSLPKDNTQKEVIFEITPDEAKKCIYQINISELKDELNYENNKKIFCINVLKSKINVLWVSSSPTWNFKFAKLELENTQDIEFDWRIKIKKDEKIEIPDKEYDVVILENIESLPNAKGIITIGNNQLSPFILSDRIIQASSNIKVIKNYFIFGREELPILKEIYKPKLTKEGSSIFCKYKDLPIIGEIDLGETKIIGIAAKDIWRWNFHHQIKFWEPLIKYLAIKKIPHLYVETQKIYNVGERIIFNAEAYTQDYKPDPNCEIIIKINSRIIPLYSLGDGKYQGIIDFLPQGTYTYHAISSKGDTIKDNFIIIADKELQTLEQNISLLQQISAASGGKFIKDVGEIKIDPQQTKTPLLLSKFHISLLLLIFLLSLEWLILRKR